MGSVWRHGGLVYVKKWNLLSEPAVFAFASDPFDLTK
jgi:hypothetical protein